jgi:hypothetical protein
MPEIPDVWAETRNGKRCVDCGRLAHWVFGKRGVYGFRVCAKCMSPEERLAVELMVTAGLTEKYHV